ncbi:MAG: hypothetical protein K6G89_05140 [Clostridia bacterium]|nr:hypothetical protein [Clostridia bacterium]
MAKNGFTTVISIKPGDQQILFLSAVGRDKNSLKFDAKSYRSRFLDEEFYKEFSRCLSEYANSNPSYAGKSAFVTVILPDSLISTSSFNIPGVNKKNTMNLFNVAVESTYANIKELKANNYMIKQNKQYATFCVSLIRQKLVQGIYTACSGCNMFANTLTFEASTAGCGATALNNKLANETCLVVDIKEVQTIISYVSKGITIGCIDLPFGWSILKQPKPVAENMLFSHDVAELAVINAKEKAKAKQLTMMGGDNVQEENQEAALEADAGLLGENPAAQQQRQINTQTIKTLPKKTPRVLPKWMQRPVPDTPEGVTYENFRVFVKYVLEFIRANGRLTAISEPTAVYVNMPEDFDFLFELVNEEAEENKIKFVDLGLKKEKPVIREHLELYGGLFADQYGSLNNF